MNYFSRLQAKSAIRKTAEQFGETFDDTHREIQRMIDDVWASSNPDIRKQQNDMFPNGKPTPEELILTIARIIKEPDSS